MLSKPDKLYINNTNLIYAVSKNCEIGTLRETFFVNQIKSAYINNAKLIDDDILLSNNRNFLLNSKYTVEIGGKNKSYKQIKDIKNSFIVADDIVLTSLRDCRHETLTKSKIWEVTDSDEVGYGNLVKQSGREAMTLCEKIPLWLFGFLY